jgi:hypothetical protein
MSLTASRAFIVPSRYALFFDGVDDYVDFGDALDFPGRAPFSVVSIFMDWGRDYSWRRLISKERSAAPRQGWLIFRDAYTNIIALERWRDGSVNRVLFAYAPHTWNHVAFTYDGTTMRGYLNGELKASLTSTLSLLDLTQPLTVAKISDVGIFYRVMIVQIMVYSRALSDLEVLQNFRNPFNPVRDGLELCVVAHPDHVNDIDGDAIPEWIDLSGKGRHGKIYGARVVEVVRAPARL